MNSPDFLQLPDLASRALAGSVMYANDELFAQRENLISPEPAAHDVSDFGHKGKVYDGWETRRRREPGHDYAIVRLGAPGVHGGKDLYPPLDVLALQAPHGATILLAETCQVAVVDANDVGVGESEIDVEGHQLREARAGVIRPLDHRAPAVAQLLAHADEDRPEQRLLVGEVAVDRRAAHTDRRTEVFEADAGEPPLGEQACRLGEESGVAVGLGSVATRGACHFS